MPLLNYRILSQVKYADAWAKFKEIFQLVAGSPRLQGVRSASAQSAQADTACR
jgi:hypothetical protein